MDVLGGKGVRRTEVGGDGVPGRCGLREEQLLAAKLAARQEPVGPADGVDIRLYHLRQAHSRRQAARQRALRIDLRLTRPAPAPAPAATPPPAAPSAASAPPASSSSSSQPAAPMPPAAAAPPPWTPFGAPAPPAFGLSAGTAPAFGAPPSGPFGAPPAPAFGMSTIAGGGAPAHEQGKDKPGPPGM
mmetsp:Transcript_41292/g.103758  ORF Transcript_41292/g.103758 Transcript_41292/m.103758 type:complete len:187 (-) Transcript_41292:181-741(-)